MKAPKTVNLMLKFLVIVVGSSAQAASFSSSLELATAFNIEDDTWQKNELLFEPEFQFDLGAFQVTSIVRLRSEFEDKLEPGHPDQSTRSSFSKRALIGSKTDVELREFYLDRYLGDAFLRVGKQQIVWGEADGIKLLDVINPQSFREFILPEFDDSRIPLWSINLDLPLNDDWNAQFLWIPDNTYHDIPERGATFEFTSPAFVPLLPAGQNVTVLPVKKPSSLISDADFGGRVYGFLDGWEVSLNYFYHHRDEQVLFTHQAATNPILAPEYKRNHLIGGSFNNAFGDWVLRGEMAYNTDQYAYTGNEEDVDGVIESREFNALIGLDYQGITDVFLSTQIYSSWLIDHQNGVFRDSTESQMTLLYEHNFLNESLKTSLLIIQSLNSGDGLIQAEVEYEYSDQLILSTGFDYFHGNNRGLFGQFDQNDRLSMAFKYGF